MLAAFGLENAGLLAPYGVPNSRASPSIKKLVGEIVGGSWV